MSEKQRPRVPLPHRPSQEDIDDELAHHLEGRIEELIAAGMSRGAAEHEARLRFGDAARVRSATARVYRRRRRFSIAALQYEAVGAFRALRRRPGHALTAILLLTVGIGLATAMIALVDVYLLRELPYPAADRLVRIHYTLEGNTRGLQPPPAVDWSELPSVVELTTDWDLDAFTLVGDDRPEQVLGAWVPPEYFEIYGLNAGRGRVFTRAETDDETPVAVVSHALWQRRWSGDPGIVGRTVSMYASDRPDETANLTIVGVLPEDAWHATRYAEILAPLPGTRTAYMARLAEGIDLEEAAGRMTAFGRDSWGPGYENWNVELTPLHEAHVFRARPLLIALATAVGFVLLITVANVAVLMLLHAAARQREFAVRAALGAGRTRLAMQLLAEAAILGLTGAALGLLVAWEGLHALGPWMQEQLGTSVPGGLDNLTVDPRVAVMAIGLTLFTTLLLGLAPLASGVGSDPSASFGRTGRGATSTRQQNALRTGLVVVELALTLALLVGAGLMVRTALHVARFDPGFRPDGLIAAEVGLSSFRYPDEAAWQRRADEILEAVRRVDGVREAALVVGRPYASVPPDEVETLDGPLARSDGPAAVVRLAGPGYFAAAGVPLIEGREFGEFDRLGSEAVAIVSEAFAAAYWPGSRAIGRTLRLTDDMRGADPTVHRVVGVVGELPEGIRPAEQSLDVWAPLAQWPRPYFSLVVRSERPFDALVPALEDAVQTADPEQPLVRPVATSEWVQAEGATPRALAGILAGFAAFAVLLAAIGVYGVIAFAARRRRREIALRIALGANPGNVRRMVLMQGARVVAAGLVIGLAVSWLLSRTLAAQLHGVPAHDPATFVSLTLLLGGIALAGVVLPARRAARSDPMMLLREG